MVVGPQVPVAQVEMLVSVSRSRTNQVDDHHADAWWPTTQDGRDLGNWSPLSIRPRGDFGSGGWRGPVGACGDADHDSYAIMACAALKNLAK